jgi:hypothetical protein
MRNDCSRAQLTNPRGRKKRGGWFGNSPSTQGGLGCVRGDLGSPSGGLGLWIRGPGVTFRGPGALDQGAWGHLQGGLGDPWGLPLKRSASSCPASATVSLLSSCQHFALSLASQSAIARGNREINVGFDKAGIQRCFSREGAFTPRVHRDPCEKGGGGILISPIFRGGLG